MLVESGVEPIVRHSGSCSVNSHPGIEPRYLLFKLLAAILPIALISRISWVESTSDLKAAASTELSGSHIYVSS